MIKIEAPVLVDLLTPAEVSRLLRVSQTTLRKWAVQRDRGELVGPPFVRLSGATDTRVLRRYERRVVEEWLATNSI